MNNVSYDYEYHWFPPEVFSRDELTSGLIAFYYIGVIYLTIASIVLSYNYFVPSVLMISKEVR